MFSHILSSYEVNADMMFYSQGLTLILFLFTNLPEDVLIL